MRRCAKAPFSGRWTAVSSRLPGDTGNHRRGDRDTRRMSGDRFLMPDTTPIAIYNVTMEDPP